MTKGILVIGGGIAGVQAALDIADAGIKVYLIERSSSIGGHMAQLDKTFPTNDCAMCILSPKLVGVARHSNIELITNSEVSKVEGEKGDFKVKILKHPRYIDEEKCVGCGECTDSCPVRNRAQIPEFVSIKSEMEQSDIKKTDKIIEKYIKEEGSLIPILQDINTEYNYLPEDILRYVSERLEIQLSQIYHVATFYTAFSLTPRGKHLVKVCQGTACHVRGGARVLSELERKLDIKAGETTPDLKFTLETVNCLGACALGPVVVIDDEYHPTSPAKIEKFLKKYEELDAEGSE